MKKRTLELCSERGEGKEREYRREKVKYNDFVAEQIRKEYDTQKYNDSG